MDFTPHTDADIRAMLEVIGIEGVEDLFRPIPGHLLLDGPLGLPAGQAEAEVLRDLGALAARNRSCDEMLCFLGGGSYDHHVPSIVWPLLGRGEFSTSYTPYQPELSQGVLQALFEYQTMVCELAGMEVSNASLYDGAGALSEAVTMAAAATGRHRVVVAGPLNPLWRGVLTTQGAGLGVAVEDARWGSDATADPGEVASMLAAGEPAALVVQQPNALGCIENIPPLADAAHAAGARLVVCLDLTAAGILQAPGDQGADIVVADGGALGNHLAYGGPTVGIIAARMADVRRMPGRIVGLTADRLGRRAFTLTLQAREQHIRREKATSNICTNQTLNALATAMTLAWLGPEGLRELGERCLAKARFCRDRLCEVAGAEPLSRAPTFKEFAVRLPADPAAVAERCAAEGILAGLPLGRFLPGAGLEDGLLVAVTEKRSREEIEVLAESVARACKETA